MKKSGGGGSVLNKQITGKHKTMSEGTNILDHKIVYIHTNIRPIILYNQKSQNCSFSDRRWIKLSNFFLTYENLIIILMLFTKYAKKAYALQKYIYIL